MTRSRWLGHPVSLVTAGAVALTAGSAVTAAITSQTRVTGRGGRVAAIKVGDTVSAQISETGSPPVIAIQDPVSIP